MKVSNIRFGFATNSSSTHSIVFNQNIRDSSPDYGGQCFGWDEFSLCSREAKSLYLGQTLYHNLEHVIGQELAVSVVHDLLQVEIDREGYVDHQSLMWLPINPKTRHTSIEFFKELTKRYLKPDIVIVGGNDNSEFSKFEDSIRHDHLIPTDIGEVLLCRKDGDWWLLQNKNAGTKIRLTFNDRALPYIKATSPELVDLKITDMCLNKCPYCYQNSTPEGRHAKIEDINQVIYTLADMNVFEVALGGGEPTLHPYFVQVLYNLHYHGIITNFTTRRLDWVHNDLIVEAVEKYVSRFGVSIQYARDIDDTLEKIPKKLHDKIYFHYVIGTGSLEDVLESNKLYGHPLILLGFKKTGRGATYKPYSNDTNMKVKDNWLDVVKEKRFTIGIDTALANEYKEQIKDLNQFLVTYDEGKFSMYIDAVEMKMGKCSYADDYTSVKDFRAEDYLKLFASY